MQCTCPPTFNHLLNYDLPSEIFLLFEFSRVLFNLRIPSLLRHSFYLLLFYLFKIRGFREPLDISVTRHHSEYLLYNLLLLLIILAHIVSDEQLSQLHLLVSVCLPKLFGVLQQVVVGVLVLLSVWFLEGGQALRLKKVEQS